MSQVRTGTGTGADSTDAMISDMTSAMEVIQIPDNNPAPTPTLITPDPERHRPLDTVAAAGPPAPPLDFDRARFERGRRDDVLVYIEQTREHNRANVLFRDFSREYGDADGALSRVKQAYWPLPHKEKIKTIMGHVEICIVLTRCIQEQSDDDDSSSSSSVHEDDDIVFQLTNRYVAVKVNYCDRMDQLKGRHAEDPLKEIAAMQLIGNSHPNVMGVVEVLFDGSNLNVVMPYCGSGDLFQLLNESQTMGTGFSEPVARYWFRQIMAGVQYLHGKGICHRDLSPENVMMDNDGCLIIDMGMAIRIPYGDAATGNITDITAMGAQKRLVKAQGACGKLPYMSPEIYRNQTPFDCGAVDIWTAGTILFCMVTGNRSYQRPHDSDPQYYWMTHGLRRLVSDWGVELSPECLHLLEYMMQVDPRLRFTLEEVLHHPWFALPDGPPPSQQGQQQQQLGIGSGRGGAASF
jgi:serine/threonine protein kinase